MKDLTTSKLKRMGRRRFLRTLAALGVSGPALRASSQEAIAELNYDPGDEVLRVAGWTHTNHKDVKQGAFPEREPIYYTIPRKKWVTVETADNAARALENKLRKKLGPDGISVGVEIVSDKGQDKRGIVVEHVSVKHPDGSTFEPGISFDNLTESVPSYVDGTAGKGTKYETTIDQIPVKVKKITEIPEVKGEYYTNKYDHIPGGCYHETDPVAGYTTYGTVGTPAKKKSNNDPVLIASGHNFDHNNDGTLDASELHQPEAGDDLDFVGWVDEANADPDLDWAMVGFDSGRAIEWDMAADAGGYKNHEINGIRSRQYLNDNMGMDLKKQGTKTGTQIGAVRKLGSTWVKIDDAADSQKGDSGGPYYDTTTEYYDGFEITAAKIAAIHRGTADSDGLRKGTLMESVEDAAGVTI